MSLIKTATEIRKLRAGGKILADVLQKAKEKSVPGISLLELDTLIESWILEADCTPSFKGFEGFPYASCLSVNDRLVHGIPNAYVLKEGDVLGIDVGLWHEKLCVDSAITVGVGQISPEAQALLAHTQEALAAGIKAIKPYRKVGAISQAVQEVAEKYRLGIVRTLTGHGVGHKVHEEPTIPNFGKASDGIILKTGMVLAIEPMFTLGTGEVYTEVDGWTVTTSDHTLSAQFEHTIVVTKRGAEILSQ